MVKWGLKLQIVQNYRQMQTVLPSEQGLQKKLFHKQSVLISDQQKFPQLFKWKTATLILGALSSILLIVLLVTVYNIQAQEQVAVNLTFLSSIVLQSKILQNKQQVINLSKNFEQIYGTTKFQNARLIFTTGKLNSDHIRYSIYSQQNEKLLYIVELQLQEDSNTYPVRFAIFMNSQFPLPKEEDFNSYIKEYYSFEAKDQRKSSLLSLYTNKSLRLSSTQVTSIAECPNYKYIPKNPQRDGSFRLLKDLVHFSFQTPKVSFNTSGWNCFWPTMTGEQDLNDMLKNMLHPNIINNDTVISLANLEVYYLS